MINSLCITPPKIKGYLKTFNETTFMSFLINDKQLIKNTLKSGIKLAALLTKKYFSESIFYEKYFKTKTIYLVLKLVQVFVVVKHVKSVLIVCVHQ